MSYLVSIFSNPNNKHLLNKFMQHILRTTHCATDFINNNSFNSHNNSMREIGFLPILQLRKLRHGAVEELAHLTELESKTQGS